MKDTLAIIGSHPRTREAFDFNRVDADIWLFNEAISNKENIWAKRADAVFQMHIPTIWRNPANRNDPKHYEWLKTQTECDVIMQDVYEDVPRSKKYPLDGIQDMLSGDPNHFLSSSVALAIAYAAYLGIYKRIEIYGVAMETNTEYQFQREGVSFWFGFLKGRGVDVFFADETFLCPMYGYEGKVTYDYEQFIQRINELTPEVEKAGNEYKASIVNVQQAVKKFEQDASAENEANLFEMVGKQRERSEYLGKLDGARQENEKYKKKADVMKEADGGKYLFSRQEFESSAKALHDKAQEANVEFISAGTTLDHIHRNLKQAAKDSPKRAGLVGVYKKQLDLYLALANKVAVFTGASQENFAIMSYMDKYIRAVGGSKSEAVLLESMQNVTVP